MTKSFKILKYWMRTEWLDDGHDHEGDVAELYVIVEFSGHRRYYCLDVSEFINPREPDEAPLESKRYLPKLINGKWETIKTKKDTDDVMIIEAIWANLEYNRFSSLSTNKELMF